MVQDDHGFTALHIACGRDNPWAVARIGRHPAMDSINAVGNVKYTEIYRYCIFDPNSTRWTRKAAQH